MAASNRMSAAKATHRRVPMPNLQNMLMAWSPSVVGADALLASWGQFRHTVYKLKPLRNQHGRAGLSGAVNMTATLRHTLLSVRDLALTAGPFVILTLVLLLLAYWVLDPTPPRHVVLATGAPQGAYAQFGKRYADLLKGYGIKVELRATDGAAENLKLLRDPNSGVDIAFVQGGADEREDARRDDEEDDGLRSLGSMFFEPVWLFYREDAAQKLTGQPTLNALSQLPGWRLNIEQPGSGLPNHMTRIPQAHRLAPGHQKPPRHGETPADGALLHS